jgi:hypothetical protein
VKVFLYFIGKARDEHANAIAAEFIKRSSRYAACEMREIVPQRFDGVYPNFQHGGATRPGFGVFTGRP